MTNPYPTAMRYCYIARRRRFSHIRSTGTWSKHSITWRSHASLRYSFKAHVRHSGEVDASAEASTCQTSIDNRLIGQHLEILTDIYVCIGAHLCHQHTDDLLFRINPRQRAIGATPITRPRIVFSTGVFADCVDYQNSDAWRENHACQ